MSNLFGNAAFWHTHSLGSDILPSGGVDYFGELDGDVNIAIENSMDVFTSSKFGISQFNYNSYLN